jgi:hypothetical protein
MDNNFESGQPSETASETATRLRQSEGRRAFLKAANLPNGRPGTRLRSTLDEAPEVHDLAERNDITLRQARELLNRFQGDQAAINTQIAILKRAAAALE